MFRIAGLVNALLEKLSVQLLPSCRPQEHLSLFVVGVTSRLHSLTSGSGEQFSMSAFGDVAFRHYDSTNPVCSAR
jgi:hypothetical protein